MFGIEFAFEHPWYPIFGVAIVVALWALSYQGLSGLGRFRRVLALVVRSVIVLLLIMALANLHLRRKSDRLTVIYLLDQSASIPLEQREAMVSYVVREVKEHRNDARGDRAAVIVFGRDANIEVAPIEDTLPIVDQLEGTAELRTDATNLAAALNMAQATFPEDSSRRIVIVSDGNENLGDAQPIARKLARDGVGIDVVPARISVPNDIVVERVRLPGDIRKGQPFEASVVLNNLKPDTGQPTDAIAGRLKLIRRRGAQEEVLSTPDITLSPGKSVYRFEHKIDEPDFYEYQVEFVANNQTDDAITQNNRATGFTHVQGEGHVLLIENSESRDANGSGHFQHLVDRLRANNITVTVQFTDELFTSLADLQRYDAVILADVPRSSGSDADNIRNFSDDQLSMLLHNTREMGCGLVMLGGPNTFGAGAWTNTDLEKAMPVNFQIENAKVEIAGALAMVMHASELAQGNHWQKVVAREALRALGPQDMCGVVDWDDMLGKEEWLWARPKGMLKVGGNRDRMIAMLDQMTPGDMPDFEPSLKMALAAFNTLPPGTAKHMIIISDGDPSPPRGTTVMGFKKADVKVSTVAIGTHGTLGNAELERIATVTGGKYYVVRDPNALPRIYQKEARKVARPLIVERDLQPQLVARHEILEGIEELPPIRGFVMTAVKESGLVEIPIISPFPVDSKNATILATWNYGLGRSVAFTSDAGYRWATSWTGWEQYDKFFSQLVRWSMRPTGDTGNFSIATTHEDGKVRVVVDALDKDDQFLNFLNFTASVVDPTMETSAVELRQSAPGRYITEFDADKSGSYFLTLSPGAGKTPIRVGVNVPYSPEFRDTETNFGLLRTLASLEPEGGEQGELIDGELRAAELPKLLATDTFRRNLAPAISINYVWPWLALIAGCLWVGDVFVRRVAINFAPVWIFFGTLYARLRRRDTNPAADARLEQLRKKKTQVSTDIDRQKSATRFEQEAESSQSLDTLSQGGAAGVRPESRPTGPKQATPEAEQEDYTARLLRAKQQARKKSGGPPNQGDSPPGK